MGCSAAYKTVLEGVSKENDYRCVCEYEQLVYALVLVFRSDILNSLWDYVP